MVKIYFNGWYSGFLDKTNPGVTVDFFLELFQQVYYESCEPGTLDDSSILCEFDMLLDCPGSQLSYKKWQNTYVFNGESRMLTDPTKYNVVLWGERNHDNIVNVPLFIPYLYSNKDFGFLDKIQSITEVPHKDICVIITNPGGEMRNDFLNELEKHFQVDYAGNYKNNIGGPIEYAYNTPEFINFVGQYKFIVTMENSREDTYITEKVVHGFLANTIPIYWGSNRIHDYWNKDRFLNLDCVGQIPDMICTIRELMKNESKYLDIVNQPLQMKRTLNNIAKDIQCVIHPWTTQQIYCVNNPVFEPDRHVLLKTMFHKNGISPHHVKYISPTYKHTIDEATYIKYTKNQLVQKHLRHYAMTIGELSLYLNYRAVLEDIERNYKGGLFLILESDAFEGKELDRFHEFVTDVKDKAFDLIHIGMEEPGIYDYPLNTFTIGYRAQNAVNPELQTFCINHVKNNQYIEDITDENSRFRLIRKFNTRCTDSFLWKYDAVIQFLNYMRTFEDYSMPFDYYMCHYFETHLDFKHYWSVNEFFKQASNLQMIPSTLDRLY